MEKKTCNTVLTPETVLSMAHGPVAGQNWRPFVPMAVYVPVRDPSAACVSVTDMFVIPAAGPADTHVPVMFVLEGVVSDGPQEPSASVASASIAPSATRRIGITLLQRSSSKYDQRMEPSRSTCPSCPECGYTAFERK